MAHHKPEIGLSDESRAGVAEIFNTLLADEYVLYTKTRNYHWNVVGSDFHDLHLLFEKQYEELDETIDDIAEYNRGIGLHAEATLAGFLKHTRLKEAPGSYPKAGEMVRNLLADHEILIGRLRIDLDLCQTKFGDAGAADFLTGLMEQHQKTAWMLRSMLED